MCFLFMCFFSPLLTSVEHEVSEPQGGEEGSLADLKLQSCLISKEGEALIVADLNARGVQFGIAIACIRWGFAVSLQSCCDLVCASEIANASLWNAQPSA